MRINKIKRRYAKMMSNLPDNELIACIYMLCAEAKKRSGMSLNDILVAIYNLDKLVNESEDKEC